jgi:hypothetical protein
MIEPHEHEPKLAALAAYRTRQLGVAGRARIERHLADCAVCSEALAGMRSYAQLTEEAFALPTPSIDWSRMELPLRREATRLARRQRRWAMPLALAAVAAVGLLLAQQAARPGIPPAPARPSLVPARAIPSIATFLHVEITAIAGAVEGVDEHGQRVPFDLSSSPSEGWVLETASQSELHLALEGTAALIVAPGSQLALRRLRRGDVILDLTRGKVVNHVRTLAPDAHYEVVAGRYRVAVRGTRFSVERLERGLGVQVDEGRVAVLEENGALVTELLAPARWLQGSDGARQPIALPLPRPRESAPGSARWPVLELPAWPHVVGWDVDGTDAGAEALLRMRVPPADVEIGAVMDDGRRMGARFHVDALGGRFDPRGLKLIGPRPEPMPPHESLDPAQASAVIRAGEPALQRCYERALRGQSGLAGTLRARLHIDIDARGRVKRAELIASESVPVLLSDCVRQVAQSWHFPGPGGVGITFESTISFRPAR